jgi:uncharacterized protein
MNKHVGYRRGDGIKIVNVTQRRVVARKVLCCHTLATRLLGLLWKNDIAADEACWLKRCNAIHTIGMKFAIDAYFLNKKGCVVGVEKNIKPNRFSPIHWNAHSVVEFKAGRRIRCALGDQLGFGNT